MWYIVRCGDGEIKVGEVFTMATKFRHDKTIDEQGRWKYGNPIVAKQRPILLAIKKIHAYGRELQQAGQGLTVGIFLQGDIDFDPKDYCFGVPEDNMKVIVYERYPDLLA